ncbi:hypothetical protein BD289DRAFT_177424 [Coniella lustricola]|uniref:Uncharacterized protein n=1 Tax=Coniella lustricola TaxID=2025994 RepID=A0A2T2ZTJ4_9PEZI|nr:hypothetical protein BD289DRAFT_177424 [Coniella lustricola]
MLTPLLLGLRQEYLDTGPVLSCTVYNMYSIRLPAVCEPFTRPCRILSLYYYSGTSSCRQCSVLSGPNRHHLHNGPDRKQCRVLRATSEFLPRPCAWPSGHGSSRRNLPILVKPGQQRSNRMEKKKKERKCRLDFCLRRTGTVRGNGMHGEARICCWHKIYGISVAQASDPPPFFACTTPVQSANVLSLTRMRLGKALETRQGKKKENLLDLSRVFPLDLCSGFGDNLTARTG